MKFITLLALPALALAAATPNVIAEDFHLVTRQTLPPLPLNVTCVQNCITGIIGCAPTNLNNLAGLIGCPLGSIFCALGCIVGSLGAPLSALPIPLPIPTKLPILKE